VERNLIGVEHCSGTTHPPGEWPRESISRVYK
jgi:hypothetical protein